MKRAHRLISEFAATVIAILREIFDEDSYARYLKQAGIDSSQAAYAAFRREFEDAKVPPPKCC